MNRYVIYGVNQRRASEAFSSRVGCTLAGLKVWAKHARTSADRDLLHSINTIQHSSLSIYLPFHTSVLVTQHSRDAGPPKTPQLGAAQGRRQEHICDELVTLFRDDQEPAHQRRHKGSFPGLHWQAGNVSSMAPAFSQPKALTGEQFPRPASHRVRYAPNSTPGTDAMENPIDARLQAQMSSVAQTQRRPALSTSASLSSRR